MKKVQLIIMIMYGYLSLQAQVHNIFITGRVKSDTGIPVPNYIITIKCDSSENSYHYRYNNEVYTNLNGIYNCKITDIPTSAKSLDFYISLLDCYSNKIIYTAHYTAGDTMLYGNFTIFYKPLTCKAIFSDIINENTVQFSDSSKSSGEIIKWEWDFGDTVTSTKANPTHVYKDTGTIKVCLRIYSKDVMDTSTCSDLICREIYIQPNDSLVQCQAYFSFYPVTSDTSKLTIQFRDSSTIKSLAKNEEVKYLWLFGDGQTSTIKDPLHVYLNKGVYDICLKIRVVLKADTSKIYCQSIACKYNKPIGNLHKYLLGGTVYEGVLPSQSGGTAKIYRFNSNMTVLADSTLDYDTLAYYHSLPILEGNFIVKILPNDNNYFPTYYGNKLLWNNSQTITLNKNLFSEDVQLIPESSNSGTGQICGTVNLKDTLINNEGIEVLLFDSGMNPISYSLADNNRNFDFENIAFGTYNLYTEITGWTGTYTQVSIDVDNPTECGINLYANPTGVNELGNIHYELGIEIYPNPTDSRLNIEISLSNSETIELDVFNIVGSRIESKNINLNKGNNQASFDVTSLTAGIYFLKISSVNLGVNEVKKFVKY